MKFRGVIFDLDGTLIDSIEDLADSMNAVLKENSLPEHKTEEYKYLVGNGIRKLVKRAVPEEMRTDELLDKYYKSMIETYGKNCVNKSKPYKGIVDLLNFLHANNIKMAVLSNKADKLTKKVISSLLPGDFFIEVRGLQTEEHKKPNPIGALQISEIFGIPPQEIIYMGDTSVDMQTANNAGMFAVGVLWGFRTEDELLTSGAKLILSHPMDLVKIF